MRLLRIALIVALGTIATPITLQAHEAPIRIVVIGEDSDPDAMSRNSEVYNRVLAEMQDILIRDQITVIDEDMLASRANLSIGARSDKKDLLKGLSIANDTTDPVVHSRLALLFSIFPNIQNMDITRKLTVRVRGQFFDLKTMRALSSFEVTSPEATPLPKSPSMCNDTCVMEKAGEVAKSLAAEVAVVVTQKLHIIIEDSEYAGDLSGTASSTAPAGDAVLLNVYRLRFKMIGVDDVKDIISELEADWVKEVELVKASVTERIYSVSTNKNLGQLETLITDLITKLGLDRTRIRISAFGSDITVESLK